MNWIVFAGVQNVVFLCVISIVLSQFLLSRLFFPRFLTCLLLFMLLHFSFRLFIVIFIYFSQTLRNFIIFLCTRFRFYIKSKGFFCAYFLLFSADSLGKNYKKSRHNLWFMKIITFHEVFCFYLFSFEMLSRSICFLSFSKVYILFFRFRMAIVYSLELLAVGTGKVR